MMMARAPAVAIDLIHHHEAFLSLQHGAAKPLLMGLIVGEYTPGGARATTATNVNALTIPYNFEDYQ